MKKLGLLLALCGCAAACSGQAAAPTTAAASAAASRPAATAASTAPATATATATAPAKVLALTAADRGATRHAAEGTRITISLQGNATTGYSWAVSKVEGEAVAQDGDVAYTPDPAQGRVGVGGTSVAAFHVVKPGESHIYMAYRRPWETSGTPAQIFDVKIVVDAPAK